MRILITGAKGQLGQALQPVLGEHTLFPFDHKGLDITDQEKIKEQLAITRAQLVINAAAYNDVDRAESETEAAWAANETGPRSLALATAERAIPLVHVSTDYVFDGTKKSP